MGDRPAPFEHSIKVNWSDCDPAFIVFTGRIPYFALESIDAWWEHHTGLDWFQMNVDRNIGTPFVHMVLDFSSPVTPRHTLVCKVRLLRIGNSSIRHSVRGFQDGLLCFAGEFVSAFAQRKPMKSSKIPPEILSVIKPLIDPE